MAKRGTGRRLRERRQVIGQPDKQHGLDQRRRGDQVAETTAGECERLAHGARDDQLCRVLVDQLDRAGLRRELTVCLVEDKDARAQGVEQATQLVERNTLPRRVVRAGDEHDVGVVLLDRLHRRHRRRG